MACVKERLSVMHLVDTLEMGGAERLAVNLVNHLPRDRYDPVLCTTRRAGPLLASLHPDVGRLHLHRQFRFEVRPVRQLMGWIRDRGVRILHAHGSTLFIARLAAALVPGTRLIWHAHYGRFASEDRAAPAFRIAARGAAVIAASREIAAWVCRRFAFPPDRVTYLPNFVTATDAEPLSADLPGEPGFRVVVVANIRPEKDHLTLVRAFHKVVKRIPRAHLVVVGAVSDPACLATVASQANCLGISSNVSFVGPRNDIASVLKFSDVGVLSSVMEGLPMALLEYGLAGLATVATKVGECPAVLDGGRAGLLVEPQNPAEMADAIVRLLLHRHDRETLGMLFKEQVERKYSPTQAVRAVCGLYDGLVGEK